MSDNTSFLKAVLTSILNDYRYTSFILALLMAIIVGSALGFEHIGGYIPCALCLEQRIPYYIGIPTLLIAGFTTFMPIPIMLTRGLILIAGLLMVYGFYLGVFHSGVEWGWWPGPEFCTSNSDGLSNNAADLLRDLDTKKPPSCDKAAARFLGLSFAGWNVIASALLAAIILRALFYKTRT